ncbi:uncharacterized protein LOC116247704 isoform X1 [Nymphaea colorata]|nr:uncharacterized protein LOC116247704 isoform X1 [Nymphaea colorata]
MPPSPAFRRSPSPKTEGLRRQGSFETPLMFREEDHDLALFNDMDARERDDFLLTCADEDMDDSISTKLKHFSDFKLGVTVPALGDGSDLLEVEDEKNDYDWLLTPPDTPLFPSLDDESTTLPNIAQRGRPQSQPISISRSNAVEKSRSSQKSRTSASPNRLSPSPRSTSGSVQSRGRPSSAPNSSFIRPSTSPRRPSTPPSMHHSQTERSSTPTARRVSTGSSGYKRGLSPVKANRGNSASPKLSAWPSNLPGFSSDAPPNLRTSLSDRAASYVRGASPASRNGRDIANKNRRQSTSPVVSRSASSQHSDDHDHTSSYSKGSVGSSCEDEVESMQSVLPDKQVISPGISGRSIARRNEPFSKPKGSIYSKRISRPILSSSAPKRSFDSAMRQMDQRKGPQSMFRPLLSSVPSASFCLGEGNDFHQHLVSINSTLMSNANVNSDLGIGASLDTVGGDHEHNDLACGWEKTPLSDVQEEALTCKNENESGKEVPDAELQDADMEKFGANQQSNAVSSLEIHNGNEDSVSEIPTVNDTCELDAKFTVLDRSILEAGNLGGLFSTCSKCGRSCPVKEILDRNLNICQSCVEEDEFLCCQSQLPDNAAMVVHTKEQDSKLLSNGEKQNELSTPVANVFGTCADLHHDDFLDDTLGHLEIYVELHADKEMEQLPMDSVEKNGEAKYMTDAAQTCLPSAEMIDPGQSQENVIQSKNDSNLLSQDGNGNAHPSLRLEASEGAGMSLLLTRSSSVKRPVVHGKALSASSMSWDNPGFVTSGFNGMRSLSNASCSSSTDATSLRQMDARFQRQSSRRSDLENRTDMKINKQAEPVSSISVNQGNSEYAVQADADKVIEDEKCTVLDKIASDAASSFSVDIPVHDQDELGIKCMQVLPLDPSGLGTFSSSELAPQGDTSQAKVLDQTCRVDKDCSLDENAEGHCPNNLGHTSEKDFLVLNAEPSAVFDDSMMSSMDIQTDVDSVPGECLKGSGGPEDGHDNFTRSPSGSSTSQSTKDFLVLELATSAPEEVDVPGDVVEPSNLDNSSSYKEKETSKFEDPNGFLSRSITLEEATDTILFCSSIVHNLAYNAAAIAIEREKAPFLESTRPTVTILGRSSENDARHPSVLSGKRVTRSRKPRVKQQSQANDGESNKAEVELKFYETKIHHVTVPKQIDSTKPMKLESKCNCTIM